MTTHGMSADELVALANAWRAVDARLQTLQQRHAKKGDIELYEDDAQPPASTQDLLRLATVWDGFVPPPLAYSLARWNGRSIAPDHGVDLFSIDHHLAVAETKKVSAAYAQAFPDEDADEPEGDAGEVFEEVTGPVNLNSSMRRRYCIGIYHNSGAFLYLDYEAPPKPGRLGQVISIGEEPVAEFVATSLVEFLSMIATAPACDDVPEDFDVLQMSSERLE
jgi:hypothetical protein